MENHRTIAVFGFAKSGKTSLLQAIFETVPIADLTESQVENKIEIFSHTILTTLKFSWRLQHDEAASDDPNFQATSLQVTAHEFHLSRIDSIVLSQCCARLASLYSVDYIKKIDLALMLIRNERLSLAASEMYDIIFKHFGNLKGNAVFVISGCDEINDQAKRNIKNKFMYESNTTRRLAQNSCAVYTVGMKDANALLHCQDEINELRKHVITPTNSYAPCMEHSPRLPFNFIPTLMFDFGCRAGQQMKSFYQQYWPLHPSSPDNLLQHSTAEW